MAIQDCVEYLETTVKGEITLSGTNAYPSDTQATGLFAILFEETAEFEPRSAGWAQSFHSISCYILGAKTNMLEVYKQLKGEMENICITLLKNPTLGGKCDTFTGVGYANAVLNLSGVDYVGYKLTISGIKIGRSLT
jgi:hypothetical protein